MKRRPGLTLTSWMELLNVIERQLGRYTIVLFLLLIACVYGFVLLRISVLSSVQPSDSDISAQVQASPVPHIDPGAVQQIQALQDNSVSVQALFNQARSNPFQE